MRISTLSSEGSRRRTAAGAVMALVAALAVVVTASGRTPAAADPAGPGAIAQPDPQSVTADALPTVQIDGVVWSQVVVGNTVYVGGDFANARPAGSAPGVNTVPRTDLLAYDITTGNLISSFAPVLNGQVQSLTVSPDGSRLYAVGNFTTVDGKTHNRIAAWDTSTGSLLSTFNGGVDAGVHTIAVTNSTVYVGGLFANANGVARQRLAAFDTSGALTAWAPTADDTVESMTLSPDGSRLIVGGHFLNINGASARGMGSVDAVTGASLPWAVNTLLKDAGSGSAITSLGTDGTNIIGTGYSYSGGGNFEGTFSADPATGNLVWMEDCHGDTYDAFVAHGTVYTVSHAHYCGDDNGWPVYPTWQYRRSVAFTDSATGVLAPNAQANYTDFSGQPSPSIVNWFPDYQIGTYTGQGQAAWSVAGNGNYVVEGGEFPSVNGIAQQGLVRFAVRGIAPATSGPMLTGAHFVPNVNSFATGTAHISFQTNWDRDSKTLTYSLVRNSDTAHPVWSGTLDSEWWNQPQVSVTDTGLTPGATYKYRLYVTDPDGNKVAGDTVTYTLPLTAGLTGYDQQVIADGASSYWPLDEASGTVANDNANGNDADLTGVTRGVAGPVSPETGTTFAGSSSSYLATRTPLTGPNVFTLSAWVKTTTNRGGKIISFGNQQTGASATYDRQLYLDNNGRVNFGVLSPSGSKNTVTSSRTVNDGQWHQIVGQLSSTGMTLYIDGVRVGRRTDTTAGKGYVGFWRVGGDALSSWTNTPSSGYLNGSLADVAIFPTALTSAQIQQEYVASGRTLPTAPVPSDAYGQAVRGSDPDVYWRLDETSGSQAADTSVTNSPGTYFGGYTLNQASTVTTIGRSVAFNGTNATIGANTSVTPPTVYSEEAWFKTSTRNGGKILGFGNKQSGTSGSVDRNVYMLTTGQLAFGVNAGSRVVITSPSAYNDNKWHQVVATQGPDGMTLYVDGLPVTSGPTTTASTTTGYWRVGGDTSWSGANYFAGTIDEVAIYSTELGAGSVLAHYKASPAHVDRAPTAAFSSSASYLAASFDATASSDPDGTVAAYAWNFGDGSTGTGATATHSYATAGTYPVTLTVTDDEGVTGTTTQSVTVTNPPPNQLPVAAFSPSCTNLVCSFDGTASNDPDGTVVAWAWDFGDGSTGTGATAAHTYAAGGTYPVTLTVTDNRGGQSTLSTPVTVVPPNQPPVAVIGYSALKLAVNFDGTGSSDPDGTVAAYAWNFGDGATATTATARHVYAAAGQYVVTLTVTDNSGASTTATQTIRVIAPGPWTAASDTFSRTVTNGLGSAEVGGAYTLSGSKALFSVANGTGNLTMSAAGTGPAAYLTANPAQDVQGVVDVSLDSAPTGGGTLIYLATRRIGTSDYILKAKYAPTATTLYLSKVVNGTETVLATKVISGLVYNAGDTMRMRFETVGVNPTTLLGRIWKVATAEPTTWQLQTTDSEASLQAAGGYGIQTYLATTATTVPVTASFDNLQFTGVTVASFTPTVSYLAASFDASQSSSVGGTVTSYAWDFGDGSTGTGVNPSHTYANAGTYTVVLTVTDSVGGVDSMSRDITVAANQPPVAAFSSVVNNLTASVDATASTDPDGSVVGYAWDFGDGATASGATARHTYANPGSYTVTLTVTDDQGATNTITHQVIATAPNQPPVAAFSASMTNLTASVDGTASSDPDGSVVGYAWDFGDGATASGATAQHTYAAPGSYTITLTVTDNQGATTSLAQPVSATPVPPLAADTFARTVTNGWGSADSGGAWTLSGAASLFSVSGGTGRIKLASAGAGPGAYLNGVSIGDSNTTVDLTFDSVPTGGGTYGYVIARHAGTSDYRFKVKVTATAATLYLTKVVNGTETTLTSKTIALAYNLGDTLRLRFLVSGTSPTTLSGKVWKVGTTEPTAYQVSTTDSEPSLQAPGAVGLFTYLSGSSTTVPVTTSFANYTVAAP